MTVKMVEAALQDAAQAAENVNLSPQQVNAIAAELPPPRAMEKLTWQNIRLAITALGGFGVAVGLIASNEELQQLLHYLDVGVAAGVTLVGVAGAMWPLIHRNWSTFKARKSG